MCLICESYLEFAFFLPNFKVYLSFFYSNQSPDRLTGLNIDSNGSTRVAWLFICILQEADDADVVAEDTECSVHAVDSGTAHDCSSSVSCDILRENGLDFICTCVDWGVS